MIPFKNLINDCIAEFLNWGNKEPTEIKRKMVISSALVATAIRVENNKNKLK